MPLYLVATPIGNLKDITLRALEILQASELVVCEDTRVTGKLLNHFGIKKPMLPYNDHNAPRQRPRIMDALRLGKNIALTSDAGTPLISDPGYKLVREAAEENIQVIPIPGACAAVAALTISGLPTDRFTFVGFLPAKAGERVRAIEALQDLPTTLIFYESANRLPASLAQLAKMLGPREGCVARELTKLHEEARRGTLAELTAHYAQAGAPKGEVVLIIAPPPEKEAVGSDDIEAMLRKALSHLSVKDAAAEVAQVLGRPRKEIYQLALALKP